jgi:hypothetical protein
MFAYTFLRRGALALRAVEVAALHVAGAISDRAERVGLAAKISAINSLEKRIVRALDNVEAAGLRLDNAVALYDNAREDSELTADEVAAERVAILNEVL